MSTIQDIFQQAQLAEAAYANFAAFPNNPKGALEDVGFSTTQANDFVNYWGRSPIEITQRHQTSRS